MAIQNWLNRDSQERSDIAVLIGDAEIKVAVFRVQAPSNDVGFDEGSNEATLLKYIRARIDKYKPGFINIQTQDAEVNNHEFIGTTEAVDIREGDLWKAKGVTYKVTGFDTVGQPFNEVHLEVQR